LSLAIQVPPRSVTFGCTSAVAVCRVYWEPGRQCLGRDREGQTAVGIGQGSSSGLENEAETKTKN